jgi:eukaryotic-like serine/threonine-protein kinase
MSVEPGTRLGPYEIVARLGEGGMGEVYRAKDPRLGREIAIKILPAESALDEDALARFEREARAVASLSHPNIVSIHDFGTEGSISFVVTELLTGETLRERIKRVPIGWRKAVDIGAEIAEGLAAAHAKGVVHRDLKPENVFLTEDGRVKILDFGLAQTDPVLAQGDEDTVPTRRFQTDPGTIVGTLGYMAPEQLRGDAVEPTADIFALGCVLYEMVTSKRPFQRKSGAETIAAILKDSLPREPLHELIPPEFQRIIEGCVEKEPSSRFQSARDLTLTLRAIASSSTMVKGNWALDANPAGRRPRRQKAIDSIAVLPLRNEANDPNVEYLSDGITETIINQLSQLPKLKVMARSTVFRYKNRAVDAQEVGRELRVRAVLSGRLLHIGEMVTISVELVDAYDGSQLWGEQYTRELSDLVQLQEEIASEISEKLRVRLTGAEKKLLRKRHTTSSEAYQLYLKGRFHWNKRTEEGLKKGITFFREAIESDPAFALAYAGLSDCFVTLGTNIPLPPRDCMPKAKAAAQQALAIDDQLAEAWASLAAVEWWYDWNWDAAERDYKRAIKLNPNYATAHDGYAMLLSARGRVDGAIEQITKASDLDPLSLIISVHAGWPFFFARDYPSAVSRFEKTLDMDPNFIPAHGWLALAHEQQTRYDKAIASLQTALRVNDIPLLKAILAHVFARAGRRGEAEEMLTALQYDSSTKYISPYDFAVIHAGLGNTDHAIRSLEEALEDRSAWMVFFEVDPRLDPLRGEPAFARISGALRHVD